MAPIRSAAAGIYQLDKDYFLRSDGTTTQASAIGAAAWKARACSRLEQQLGVGLGCGTVLSDRTFLQDYNPRLSRYYANATEPVHE